MIHRSVAYFNIINYAYHNHDTCIYHFNIFCCCCCCCRYPLERLYVNAGSKLLRREPHRATKKYCASFLLLLFLAIYDQQLSDHLELLLPKKSLLSRKGQSFHREDKVSEVKADYFLSRTTTVE